MISNKSKTEIAYNQLKEKILAGSFRPSQRLVAADLATLFGIGLTPVREALIRLCAEDLITTADGNGFFCIPVSVPRTENLYEYLFCMLKQCLKTPHIKLETNWEISAHMTNKQDSARQICTILECIYIDIARSSGNSVLIRAILSAIERTHLVRFSGLRHALTIFGHEDLARKMHLQSTCGFAEAIDDVWQFKSARINEAVKEALFATLGNYK